MSFSAKVKEEIGKHGSHARHCQIAELLALTLATGEAVIKDDQVNLLFHPENSLITDKLCLLIDKLSDGDIIYEREGKSLAINDSVMTQKLLLMLKLSDYMNFPKQIIQKTCCKKAFIRGFFLASGSVNDPNKAYHFEIVVHNNDMAEVLKETINSFELDAKIVKRKKYYVVYLKEGSMIVDMLNIMEAYVSLMDMENIRILKDMRNDINRRVNCETANIKKTVSAAVRQIEDIEYIEKTKGLKFLSKQLRELAELRISEPEANLSELGEMLNPPISKSGVNHRLRKISKIADELRNDNQ